MVLQPDGAIVAAGRSSGNFALARYTTNGALDSSFGSGGLVTTDLGSAEVVRAMALQSDGKLVVAGGSGNDFALARYNPGGSLDTGFGTNGSVKTDFGGGIDMARGLVLQPDGKIVAVGRTQLGSVVAFAIARYNPSGSLDTTFGTNGMVTTDVNGGAFAAVVQTDGELVVDGAAGQVSADFALVGYNPDGSLDSGFGNGGIVTTDFGTTSDEAFAITLDAEGRIIAAGHAGPSTGSSAFAMARYNDRGRLTRNFGTDGKVTTSITSGDDEVRAVTIQPDGKIVLAGRDGSPDFTLTRYGGDA